MTSFALSLMPSRGYAGLWLAQTVSLFAFLSGTFALQLLAVTRLNAGPFEVALLTFGQVGAGFAASLVAGMWLDRVDRRLGLIAIELVAVAVVASVTLAAVTGELTLAHVIAAATMLAALHVAREVAQQALLPMLVRRDRLVVGNSRLAYGASGAELLAFAGTGWLAQSEGPALAVTVTAICFAASAAALTTLINGKFAMPAFAAESSAWRELSAGAVAAWSVPLLRPLAIAHGLNAFCMGMIGATILLYLVGTGFESGTLGVIFAVGGIGSVAGAFIAARTGNARGSALAIALAVAGAGALVLPLVTAASAAGVALLVLGQLTTDPAETYFTVRELSLRQSVAPAAVLARVNGAMRSFQVGGELFGVLAGGLIATVAGLRVELLLAAIGYFVVALVVFASPLRRLSIAPRVD